MKTSNLSVFIVFLIFTALIFAIAWPFRNAIIFALIIAGIFHPMVDMLHQKFKLSEQIASIVVCIVVTLGIFAPFVYLVYQISQELLVFSTTLIKFFEDLITMRNIFYINILGKNKELLAYLIN